MSKQAPDLLSWLLVPLIVAVGMVIGGLMLTASLCRVAAMALEWLGDCAQAAVFDDCE